MVLYITEVIDIKINVYTTAQMLQTLLYAEQLCKTRTHIEASQNTKRITEILSRFPKTVHYRGVSFFGMSLADKDVQKPLACFTLLLRPYTEDVACAVTNNIVLRHFVCKM